jgi:hypothetical protein
MIYAANVADVDLAEGNAMVEVRTNEDDGLGARGGRDTRTILS